MDADDPGERMDAIQNGSSHGSHTPLNTNEDVETRAKTSEAVDKTGMDQTERLSQPVDPAGKQVAHSASGTATPLEEPEVFQDPFELLKETLSLYYQTHNPERIDTIPDILQSYRGKEALLIKNLESKYGEKVSDYGALPELATGNQLAIKMSKFADKIKQALVQEDTKGIMETFKEMPIEENLQIQDDECRSRLSSTAAEISSRPRERSKNQSNERLQIQTLIKRTKAMESEKVKAIEEKKKAVQAAKGLKQKYDALVIEHRALAREIEALQRTLAISNRKNEQAETQKSQQASRIQELESRLAELQEESASSNLQLQNKQIQLQHALEMQQQLTLQLEFLLQSSYTDFNPYISDQKEDSNANINSTSESTESNAVNSIEAEGVTPTDLSAKFLELDLAATRAEALASHLANAKATKRIQDQDSQIRNLGQELQELANRLEAESGSSKSLKEEMAEGKQRLQHTTRLLQDQQALTQDLIQEKEQLELELKAAKATIQSAAVARNDLATFCLQQRDQMENLSARYIAEAQNRFLMQTQDVESREFELLRLQEEIYRRRMKKSQEEINRLNKSLFTFRIELAARDKEMRILKTELQKAAERIASNDKGPKNKFT
mmetsp:Transcript_16117/g.21305  ORF Transcript_16117/g.21305 Transcript_16117/m.21305 type:complete len:613 (+) Transcript_16117:93-1931(+)|eukprot:CAMPEP_0117757272 /NCGR_PEP_ID=MMETSP0947-20121206/14626_1 /TAXON_ID=44440 /ORGANISM="Chattonella subsalsa, Strain CCMP2191" /LENGTH=612 /DNA_ID=CAMNT_0005577121 /DNA_START=58 /DNA_END=1896 /DNA_ORIENTATION=-